MLIYCPNCGSENHLAFKNNTAFKVCTKCKTVLRGIQHGNKTQALGYINDELRNVETVDTDCPIVDNSNQCSGSRLPIRDVSPRR